jgi:methylglutaconyl-CoA hydratase
MVTALIDIVDMGSGVIGLVLNRPEKRNALNAALLAELACILRRVTADKHCRVVVLAARGRVFSAGADVSEERRHPVGSPGSPEALLMDCKALMTNASQIVVARVHGDVIGGGVGLVAAADIVVAQDEAGFILPEARLGLAATLAAATVVPRIGQSAALRSMLLGQRISGRLACEIGLVSISVGTDALDTGMADVLARLLQSSPSGLANTKALVRAISDEHRRPTTDDLYRLTSEIVVSPDAIEAAAAAKAKRPPAWTAAPPSAEAITRLLGTEQL